MTYKEYKEAMLFGLQDEIYKKSLSGLIDCHEGMGLSVPESMDRLKPMLMDRLETILMKDN